MAGFTLLIVGVLLFFTPGPSSLVVPLGLAVLGTEFVWAKRLLDRLRKKFGLPPSDDKAS